MDDYSVMPTKNQYIENIQTEFFTGGFAHCWPNWRYVNVVPGYNKFYYIVDGEFYLKIDDIEYTAHKGQLFLLPYNSTQTYYHISENYVKKYWIHCTFTCNDKDLLNTISLPHFIDVDNEKYVTELFKKVLTNNDHSITSRLKQKSYILQLLAYYFEKSNILSENIFKDDRISLLMAYIEENLHSEITINDLSDILHFHPNYLIRYFKDNMGVPPMEFINNLRVESAKKMLQGADLLINEISDQVGFRNAYYFSRVFKKKTGFTPSDYRLIAHFRPNGEDFDL